MKDMRPNCQIQLSDWSNLLTVYKNWTERLLLIRCPKQEVPSGSKKPKSHGLL